MIPSSAGSAATPASSGTVLFHVVIDDFGRSYSMDGPETNAMCLHYEVLQAARQPNRKLREVDLRADTQEVALDIMKEHFPDYSFTGPWAK
jgi:hypothetical protein